MCRTGRRRALGSQKCAQIANRAVARGSGRKSFARLDRSVFKRNMTDPVSAVTTILHAQKLQVCRKAVELLLPADCRRAGIDFARMPELGWASVDWRRRSNSSGANQQRSQLLTDRGRTYDRHHAKEHRAFRTSSSSRSARTDADGEASLFVLHPDQRRQRHPSEGYPRRPANKYRSE